MSKLGVHVASSQRRGFGELLAAGAAVVVSVDQDVMAECRRHGVPVAFRSQKSPLGEDNPPGLLDLPLADVPLLAVRWCESLWSVWLRNAGADWYIVNNELDVSTLASAQKLNAFFLACMQWCEAHGIKAGIGSFSTGCPSDDAGLTLEQRWEPLLPAVRYAAARGHALVLHAHALDSGPLSETGEAIALRHERSLRYLAQQGARPKVIVGELSNGVGGIEPDLAGFMAAVTWWDEQVMRSAWREQVVGGALYGFNAAETLAGAVPSLVRWMADHPTPIDPPGQDEGRIYDRVCHLVPQTATYDRLLMVMHAAYAARETVTFSADDAFCVPPNVRTRTVRVWQVGAFGGREALEAWVDRFYGPRPVIEYREFPL